MIPVARSQGGSTSFSIPPTSSRSAFAAAEIDPFIETNLGALVKCGGNKI
jgi:hypothetical protein